MEEKNLIKSYFDKNGNLELDKIVNDYTNYVFIIIRNMSKDMLTKEDIEEIISDVFLVVWKNKDKLDLNQELKPYIAGISKNIIKNKLRSLKVADTLDENYEIKSNFNVEEYTESKEINDIIINELKEIGEPDISIFIMFYYKGKKAREIAEIFNFTEINISTKLHRIRTKLKEVLVERGYYYGKK